MRKNGFKSGVWIFFLDNFIGDMSGVFFLDTVKGFKLIFFFIGLFIVMIIN